jgi:hypothetical protein
MNIPLLRRVQQEISNPNVHFNMGNWRHCIAGFACRLAGTPITEKELTTPVIDCALLWSKFCLAADLSTDQGTRLFHTMHWPIAQGRMSEREAACANIEYLIENPVLFEKGLPPIFRIQSNYELYMTIGKHREPAPVELEFEEELACA